MLNLDIHSDKLKNGDDEVVVVLSMEILDRKEYDGLKVNKISPSKIIDDWGVPVKEILPTIFVGTRKDLEHKVGSYFRKEWTGSIINKKT